jgi:tRNA(adenine34) deaminase
MHESKKHFFYLQNLYNRIKNSKNKHELPIGCIIVCSRTANIIAFSLNKKKHFPFDHAEVCAIRKMLKLKNYQYSDYHVYTSLEPCLSCAQIIQEIGIRSIFYGCRSPDNGIQSKYKIQMSKQISIIPILFLEKKFNLLLESFFKKKRNLSNFKNNLK